MAGLIVFAHWMEIQALVAKLAAWKCFARSVGMKKLAGIALATVGEIFAALFHCAPSGQFATLPIHNGQ